VRSIKLALDWSPNTLHSGFFYALYQGWYKEAGIDVEFINPEDDGYIKTPAKQLANGSVHFAIAPTESVISYRTLSTPVPLVAVATLLQEDTSAIVTLKESGLIKPSQLDGKSYASYAARYEDCIVKKLIQNDGGCGMLQVVNPDKFGIWDTLIKGEADATWVFMPWEGIIAKRNQIELNAFQLKDFGIPYGYSPLLLTQEGILDEYPELCKQFLEITGKGFECLSENVHDAAAFLCQKISHPNFSDVELIEASLEMLKDKWLNHKHWGVMDPKVWSKFVQWLTENRVLCNLDGETLSDLKLQLGSLYTNQYLT